MARWPRRSHVATAFLFLFACLPARSADNSPVAPELVLQSGVGLPLALVWAPDGRWFATGSGDNKVKIWDAATGVELRAFTGHNGMVIRLAVSQDGRILASGSSDGAIKLWEVVSGRELKTISGHREPIQALAFTPSGQSVVSAAADYTVKYWDTATGRQLSSSLIRATYLSALALSPDSRWLAVAASGTIKILDPKTGREIYSTAVRNGSLVRSLLFSPSGRMLVIGIMSSPPEVWEFESGQAPRPMESISASYAADMNPCGFTLSPDDRRLAVVTAEGAKVIGVENGRELAVVSTSYPIQCVAFSPDGRWIASAGQAITLSDATSGQASYSSVQPTAPFAQAVNVSPDGKWIVSAGSSQPAKMWETETGRLVRVLPGMIAGVGSPAAFSPNGRWLAFGGADGELRVYELATWQLHQWKAHRSEQPLIMGVAFDPTGDRVASSGLGTIKLWETASGRELRSLALPSTQGVAMVTGPLAFSPDGRLLASGGSPTILWDLSSGHIVHTLASYSGALAFSPDGSLLATGGQARPPAGAVRLWDVVSGTELRSFRGHTGLGGNVAAGSVTFSPDGRLLLTAGSGLAFGETTVKLWDVVTGREQLTVSGKATSVSAAFAPSGRWFVSSASDGSVTLWDSQTGAQLATLLSVGQTPDWVVVTPEGLFDGSPAGWQLVLWRLGGNTFDVAPAETFFNEFFYPGLLGELLAGKRPQPRRTVAEIDRRQPVLKLSHATPQTVGQAIKTRQVTLKIEVQEALPDTTHASGSGTRDVRLFRNSSLVKLWRGDVLQGNTGRVLLEATVPIIAGENRFTAYAFNRDNIKSADARLIMAGTENLKRKGTAYILVIGINRYSNEDYKLNYAVADATAFAEELGRQLKMLGAYAEVKIITLLNQDATKANILEALGRLAGERTRALPAATATVLAEIQPVEPEDAVFMYFAGHGTAAGPRFYLIPHDLGYAGHRTALDEPSLKTILEHSISDRELEQSFEKIDAGRLLLVIDACNSGQALEAEEKRRGPMNATGLAQLAYEKGMYILTAAQSYQAALEAAPLGHGLLTFALVEEGLKTRAADTDPKDDEVTVREWLNYAVDRVPQLQERMMEEARKLGREVVMVEGEQAIRELKKRSLQRPRVFYRREPELDPLIVARLASVQTNVRTAPVPAGPSIVGKWRVTYIGTPLPNQPKGHMVGEMDYEFRSDGTFVFTYSGGPVPAQRSRGQYNWLSPNRLRLAYGGNVELVMEVTALTADKMTWKSIQTWELEHIY